MNKNAFPLIVAFFYIILYCNCSKENSPRVHVYNLNNESVNISILIPIKNDTININNVASGTTTDYINIHSTPLGIVHGVRVGTSPQDINFYALDGDDYLITISAGDTPTLSWQRE